MIKVLDDGLDSDNGQGAESRERTTGAGMGSREIWRIKAGRIRRSVATVDAGRSRTVVQIQKNEFGERSTICTTYFQ
jgi:hypothetical protein